MEAAAELRMDLTQEGTSTDALYRRHVPSAVRLAYLLTNDESSAQDLAHDAFLKAASRLHLVRDPDRFAGYLRRTVVRTFLMQRRSASRERARAERVARQRSSPTGDPASATATHVDLLAAVRTLPPQQQAALVLRYWVDLPEVEMAAVLGCRPGTVKSTLSRGLEALRKVIPPDD